MIYVECKPHRTLVMSIANFPRKEILHDLKGKYEVCKQLAKRSGFKALLDEDPLSLQPLYFKRVRVENDLPEHDLRLLHDGSKDNYLVILCPRLPEWVLRTAKEAGINMKKYDLPDDGTQLHREINASLDKFESLLKELRDSSRLKALKRLLETQQ